MTIVLNRRNINLTSGTGQLIRMQAEALSQRSSEPRGSDVQVWCSKGAWQFYRRSGVMPRMPLASLLGLRRMSPKTYRAWLDSQCRRHPELFLVDHGMEKPDADVIFIHNLLAEASLHLDKDASSSFEGMQAEKQFFSALGENSLLIANSGLISDALTTHYGIPPAQIKIGYPGYDARRFNRESCQTLRPAARERIGVTAQQRLVGFVTSGDFHKRGLDTFLACAQQLADRDDTLRFLVLGSKRLPGWAQKHPLVANGRVHYQPKCNDPEFWMSALDLFLYPARFEEFGMVVSEASAMGIPVLTSGRVGASELLPDACREWVLTAPEVAPLVTSAEKMLAQLEHNRELAKVAAENVQGHNDSQYVTHTLTLIQERMAASQQGT